MRKLKAIKRLLAIRKIRKEFQKKVDAEIKLIDEALAYMNKWSDIPLHELTDGMCRRMNIPRSKVAGEYFMRLCINRDPKVMEQFAKLIVDARAKHDIRYISFREKSQMETIKLLREIGRVKEADELQKVMESER